MSREGASRLHNAPRFMWNIVGASRLGPGRNPETVVHTPLDALRERPDIQTSYVAWSLDRDHELPEIDPDPRLSSRLQRRQREMVLILKLMRRFNEPDGDVAAYDRERSIFELGAAADHEVDNRDNRPQSLQALYAHLTDSDAQSWATRDTDGTLLLAQHKQRVDELFGMEDGRYQVVRRDGRTILLNQWRSDMVLAGRLEENPDRLGWPIAKVKIQRAIWEVLSFIILTRVG